MLRLWQLLLPALISASAYGGCFPRLRFWPRDLIGLTKRQFEGKQKTCFQKPLIECCEIYSLKVFS